MIDITLCNNDGCPLKAVCYRSVIHHGTLDHQSVARFSIDDNGKCAQYIPNPEPLQKELKDGLAKMRAEYMKEAKETP